MKLTSNFNLFSAGFAALALAASSFIGCGGSDDAATTQTPEPEVPALKTDFGVDADKKVIKIGMLNDESGPAAAIGKPYANGKRLLAAAINAGGTGLLPEGWSVELVERDHGYNPQSSVQAYNEIQEEVLFVGTSFGTPNTLPLQPMLERDNVVAFPASLSSEMAKNKYTPPAGPAYKIEALRAIDWVMSEAEEGAKPKLGIVYQQDDYGKDGLLGLKRAAKRHGLEIVSEQTVSAGQKDFAAVVTGLKDAGADTVLRWEQKASACIVYRSRYRYTTRQQELLLPPRSRKQRKWAIHTFRGDATVDKDLSEVEAASSHRFVEDVHTRVVDHA